MANNISLTASMRSNLLSLQSISRQVSSTQNKLATGNKVNSAIDNPSSYYTARSLNNRANDLDALLDSMGQAVSTIKAATTALETGATFLEQAAAVATSALETNTIPAKSYFEELVGENGAVVSTAQELKDAVNSGKEIIIIYGKIDYFEGSDFALKGNQKLVGTEYFTGYTGQEKFSQLNMSSNIKFYDNSAASDLSITINAISNGNFYTLDTRGKISLHNIELNSFATLTSGWVSTGVFTHGSLTLSGNITLNHHSNTGSVYGIYAEKATINSSANLYTTEISLDYSALNVDGGAFNLSGKIVYKYGQENSQLNIADGAAVNYNVDIPAQPGKAEDNTGQYAKQYDEILEQYDSVIKDSSYKGNNLLRGDKLGVRFNENGSANLSVNGKDMSSEALGLSALDWTNQGDIAQSLQEIANALKSIRAFTAELGNNYSIITNRQEFTENLINILTEGADKLTLADMNEESANILALQTRQQLAINSLSLASQASQAVLKLF